MIDLRRRLDTLVIWWFILWAIEIVLIASFIFTVDPWLAGAVWLLAMPLLLLHDAIAAIDQKLHASEREFMR